MDMKTWDKEELVQIALKFKSRRGFSQWEKEAYNYAVKIGIIDEICAHIPKRGRKASWSIESMKTEALKYKTRTEFVNGSPAAYYAAYSRGIVGEICSHMIEKRHDWNLSEIKREALKYRTRAAFSKGSTKAYRAAREYGFLDEVCEHMVRGCEINRPTIKEIKKEALKYKTRTAFAKGSGAHYRISNEMGILDSICAHMGRKRKIWTYEELKALASKYKTKKQFRDAEDAAYQAAYARRILKDICSHMKKENSVLAAEIMEEAKKHKTRRSFRIASPQLYQKASSLKILNEACAHMVR